MPDWDDIFEEIFDAAKKFAKNRRRKQEKAKKRDQEGREKERYAEKERARAPKADPPALPQQTDRATTSPHDGKPARRAVKSAELRDYLDQAASYERGILELMSDAPTEFSRTRMEELSRSIDHWRRSLDSLVMRVDQFQQNELLQRDMKSVPKAIARLESQLQDEAPAKVAQELKRTLQNRQNQLASLQQLEQTMQWAEVKIENTVSMLGTIYSQAMMSQSSGQVSSYQRLLAEIEEESVALDDYLTTIEEIRVQ